MIITRKFEFDSGHRIYGHENKCSSVHGHRYVCEVHFRSESLDGLGRVIDFGVIKSMIGNMIDNEFDHRLILWKCDPLAQMASSGIFGNYLIVNNNPTAENLSSLLMDKCSKVLIDSSIIGVDVVMVRLWETPNCSAICSK